MTVEKDEIASGWIFGRLQCISGVLTGAVKEVKDSAASEETAGSM